MPSQRRPRSESSSAYTDEEDSDSSSLARGPVLGAQTLEHPFKRSGNVDSTIHGFYQPDQRHMWPAFPSNYYYPPHAHGYPPNHPQLYEATWFGRPSPPTSFPASQIPKNSRELEEPQIPWTNFENSMLSAMTGFFANQVAPELDGKIRLEKIPWDFVAAYIQPVPGVHTEAVTTPKREASSCLKQWKKLFPNHFLLRIPTGVVLCKFGEENSAGNSHESGMTITGNNQGSNPGGNQEKFESAGSSSGSYELIRKVKKRPRKNWTEEEKTLIDELQLKHGNKWTLIAAELPSQRTATEVKNYWHHNKHKIIEDREESSKSIDDEGDTKMREEIHEEDQKPMDQSK